MTGPPTETRTEARPGSAAATEHGCLCPVLINGPGTPSDNLLIAPDCALHSPADQ
jgi:hypothetical protein